MHKLRPLAAKLKELHQSSSSPPTDSTRPLSRFSPKDNLFLFINLVAVAVLMIFLFATRQSPSATTTAANRRQTVVTQAPVRPLDQVSSVQVAINLALLGKFEETYWLAEQAIDVAYLDQLTGSTSPAVDKPQLVNTSIKTRKDIINYVVSAGDTIDDLAARFSVSADSIRWSNGLTSSTLREGQELAILPGFDGVVYRVREQDTINSILTKYRLPRASIVGFNDLVDDQLPVDEFIFLPSAKPLATTPAIRPVVASIGYRPLFGPGGYVFGHCTYYVATKIGVPYGLGNANRWDDNAARHGYTLSSLPQPGAIAQTDGFSYYGHVAFVEDVRQNEVTGETEIKYSDMNGRAGWNRVYSSGWVSKSYFDVYLIPPS